MQPITRFTARTVVLPDTDIDTDQIIPARFLTTTTREGLGRHLFADRRLRPDGTPDPHFPLDQVDVNEASILVAGSNFGCGSSREHAPWALLDYGLRAVLSSRLADIFRTNALKNGLLALEIAPDLHAALLRTPGVEVTVDLPACTLTVAGEGTVSFEIDGFARHCLMEGVDQLGFLLAREAAINAFEERRA